jgi:hypothetical protein
MIAFFTKAKALQAKRVKEILQHFCLDSPTLLHKSRFLPSSNLTNVKVAKYASIVEFHHTYKLDKYLGFPFLSNQVKKHDLAYILDTVNG